MMGFWDSRVGGQATVLLVFLFLGQPQTTMLLRQLGQALLEKSPKSSISRRLIDTKLKTELAKRYFTQSFLLLFLELISSPLVGAARKCYLRGITHYVMSGFILYPCTWLESNPCHL